MQPIMAHTSSKSLVELSTDEHETTFVNVTTPSTLEAVELQQTPTAPTVQPSVAPVKVAEFPKLMLLHGLLLSLLIQSKLYMYTLI